MKYQNILNINKKLFPILYIKLLYPWEKNYKHKPKTGSFDIRSKEFTSFRRENFLEILPFKTKYESHNAINDNPYFGKADKNIIILQNTESSIARSIFKNLRNSFAHADVEKVKIQKKWFLLFNAKRGDNSDNSSYTIFKMQIQEDKLEKFLDALKTTEKMQ